MADKEKQSKTPAANPYPTEEAPSTTDDKMAEPHVGQVFVKFNAGGHGSFVDPNPAQPGKDDDGDGFSIVWVLQRPENANPNFSVRIGNVVLCDKTKEPDGFDSHATSTGWEWKFAKSFPQGAYQYDLFFVYEYTKKDIKHVVSLRQVVDFDPTVFTPPGG